MNKKIEFIGKDKTEVYSRFTFEEFWRYINPHENLVFEVRMKSKDKKYHPKILGKILKVPYHFTGVFIKSAKEFEDACIYGIKNKLTMYLSVQPKRKSFHGEDKLSWETYNGKKQSELGIFFILFDFDPTSELKNSVQDSVDICYLRAKKFLEENRQIKNYCLIGSGNGCQIRVPLDEPIMFPKPEYDENNVFIEDKETTVYHSILKTALKDITKKYTDDKVQVDSSAFEVSRVGRCPFSINWKENNKKFAGIIEIVDEEKNVGLSEFILGFWDELYKEQELTEIYKDKTLAKEFTYTVENINKSKLALLLSKDELPGGGRNNILFFQFKLLCLNNGIDLNHEKIKSLVRKFERVQKEKYPLNTPSKGTFHPEAIINWCIEHNIKPIYEVLYYKPIKRKLNIDLIKLYKFSDKILCPSLLPEGKNITQQIIAYFKATDFIDEHMLSINLVGFFNAFESYYGKEKLEYIIHSGVLNKILQKI